MDSNEPRYEWRVWAEQLDEISARVRAVSECQGTRRSSETYIVSRAAVATNSKVRDQQLDLKVLCDVQDGFERWDARLKSRFPLEAGLLTAEVLPRLGLPAMELRRGSYSLPQLLDEVVAPHPELAGVEVAKYRRAYEVDGCIAEIADVTIAGRDLQTVALESVDLDALREACRSTGMDGHRNVNYPRIIRETIGWPAG